MNSKEDILRAEELLEGACEMNVWPLKSIMYFMRGFLAAGNITALIQVAQMCAYLSSVQQDQFNADKVAQKLEFDEDTARAVIYGKSMEGEER